MKIHILSDLHLEHNTKLETIGDDSPDADVLVLAGDIVDGKILASNRHVFNTFMESAKKKYPNIVYVYGNHEYYYSPCLLKDIPSTRMVKRVGDVSFVCATLWPDASQADVAIAILSTDGNYNKIKGFNLDIISDMHHADKEFIIEHAENETRRGQKVVIVSHFMPSYVCVHETFVGHSLNPAFVTPMDDVIMEFSPAAWIFGHTHNSVDKIFHNGKTRMVSNPRGYPWSVNREFDKFKLIEI